MTAQLVVAALGVVLAFAFALAEAAIGRVSRVRAEELEDEGRGGAKALVKVVGDSAAYLSVLSFVRIIAEATVSVTLALTINNAITNDRTAFLVAVGAMAVIGFVVVSVSPRTLGRQHSARIALIAAPIAIWLRRLLGPISRLLVLVANMVTPGRGFKDGPFESESELRGLLDLAQESDVIEDDERELIHSVFEFGDTVAREVMVPRTDMVTIDADRNCRQAMGLFLRSGFSRLPVVGEDSDDVVGLLYFRDVVLRTTEDAAGDTMLVTEVMRPMPFWPESKPVDDLLKVMQAEQTHMAIVVDEYGGTAGLVTIEDLLEELVGEIVDEYDNEDPEVEDLGDGTWRVDATMSIDDLADHFDVEIEDDEVDTVGGLLAKTIGRVPIIGSTGDVGGLRLTADRLAGRRHRIASVVVERLPQAEDDEGDD